MFSYRSSLILAGSLALGVFLFSPLTLIAQETGSISGRAITAEGDAADDAVVTLVQLRVRVAADDNGEFMFEAVPPGDYLLEVTSLRHGRWVESVTVAAGESVEVEIALENEAHSEEILVTGSAVERSQFEVATPSNVLSGDDLQSRLQPSIGETLANEPGVNSTYFGPGSSRPVIRGLGGDRVRMLETGIDVGDASSASPDHNVSTEPAHAERIEVLRGPATLLYGSSAIGGVVNVIDGLIPSVQSEKEIGGHFDLRGGSVNDEIMGALSLEGGGGDWGWHLHALTRDTGDYEIPGFAEVPGLDDDEHEEDEHGEEGEEHDEEGEEHDEEGDEHEEEEDPERDRLSNSDIETTSVGIGATHFFKNRGFLGISVSGYDTNYGVPGGGEHGHEEEHGDEHGDEEGEEHEEDEEHDEEGEEHAEEEEGEGIRIDMQRLRFDLRSEITKAFGFFQGFKARLGLVDYEHDEVEPNGEVGTTFFTDSYEGRLELIQKARNGHTGSIGLQLRSRDIEAIGEEAFIPQNDALNIAAFTFQELERGHVRYQFGARLESQENDSAVGRSRSFTGFSGSVGVVWDFTEGWSLASSLARSTKFPNGEELYSFGAHFATQAFEVGDANLDEETSLGLDISLRKTEGRFTGDLTLFRNDFSDFIFQTFTGEEEDELPILLFTQADAEFEGVEFQGQFDLWQKGHQHLDLELFGDMVSAELSDTGAYLPRIPPMRIGAGIHYRSDRFNARAEIIDVDSQTDLSENETPTDGYTMVNASLGYRLFTSRVVYDFMLRGRNLTDEDARNHVSFLKDRVPLPGRDLSLSVRASF